jgi:predicted secreted protein
MVRHNRYANSEIKREGLFSFSGTVQLSRIARLHFFGRRNSDMRHLLHTFRVFFLVLLLLSGCDLGDSPKSEPRLDLSVNGKRVAYASDQSFSLELDLNADAGYSWYVAIGDTTVVYLDSTAYRPKSGNWNMDGGLTVETFYFRALKTGQCSINLVQRQGWLPDVPPVDSVRFTVTVYR